MYIYILHILSVYTRNNIIIYAIDLVHIKFKEYDFEANLYTLWKGRNELLHVDRIKSKQIIEPLGVDGKPNIYF